MPRSWQFQEAGSRFSALVEEARSGEPQVVTLGGGSAVIVISYEDYERLRAGAPSAWDIFKTAPRLDEQGLPIERDTTTIRPIDLS
jgi:prevent-host-death family protein